MQVLEQTSNYLLLEGSRRILQNDSAQHGNEILITPIDISRVELRDEGTNNLEIGPIDPKWLWMKIHRKGIKESLDLSCMKKMLKRQMSMGCSRSSHLC